MSDCDDRSDGGKTRGDATCDVILPDAAVALAEFRAAAIEHGLGYFRSERFVIFGYCPGGGEVIWKDGHSSGFGTGGWRMFLQEVVPVARRHGADLGDMNGAGTHVLLIDRVRDAVYAAPRESAENFLARINDLAPPRRPCLCAPLDCVARPVSPCPLANNAAARDLFPGCDNPAVSRPDSSPEMDVPC